MSTYQIAETALLELVRGYAGGTMFTDGTVFTGDEAEDANSSIDDWGVFDASGTKVCAVVEMGAASKEGENLSEFGNEVQAGNGYGTQGDGYLEVHQCNLWLGVKREQGAGGDAASKADIKALTEAVKDYIRPYQRLNHGEPIVRARIISTTPPGYFGPQESHAMQCVVLRVMCEAQSTPLETGW